MHTLICFSLLAFCAYPFRIILLTVKRPFYWSVRHDIQNLLWIWQIQRFDLYAWCNMFSWLCCKIHNFLCSCETVPLVFLDGICPMDPRCLRRYLQSSTIETWESPWQLVIECMYRVLANYAHFKNCLQHNWRNKIDNKQYTIPSSRSPIPTHSHVSLAYMA